MADLNALAQDLNQKISAVDNAAMSVLSERGKTIYFPSKGILGQSAEAKDVKLNATIGTAFEEDGSPLCLECLEAMTTLPSQSFLYMPSFGMPDLRTKWKEMLSVKNPSLKGKETSLPVVTNALTHGLSVAGYLFVNPGDTIILPDMNWDNYELIFGEAYGAKFSTFATFVNGGFNVAGLEQKLNEPGEKKLVLLNFPNNPTGYTVTEAEAKAIVAVIEKAAQAGKKIVALIDDAYFGLVYEQGIFLESIFAPLADLHKNVLAVKLDGPTKEDYVWGFRVGFITFGIKGATADQLKAMENKAGGVVRGAISNSSSIGQKMLLEAYKHPDYAKQKEVKYTILRKRYEAIKEIFAKHPEYKTSFEPMPFNSGYFMCVKPVGVDAEEVRKELIKTYSTGVIMLAGLIRLAFSAVALKDLETLFQNLHAAIAGLQKK